MADFSGTVYDNRRSAGAYEYAINCATLLSTVGCFSCLPAGQLQLIELALLCEIAKKFFGVPLSNGLVAYWQLEEASGLRVDSVNGFDLAPSGAPLPGNAVGIIGNCVQLVSANSPFLRNVSPPALPSSGYTLNSWINPNNIGPVNRIFTKGVSGNFQFNIAVNAAGKVTVSVSDSIGGSVVTATINSVLSKSFTMVTLTVIGSNSVKLYLNGVLDISAPLLFPALSEAHRMDLGTNLAANGFFDGLIDETGLWNRPLSAAEVVRLFNLGAGVPFNQLQFS